VLNAEAKNKTKGKDPRSKDKPSKGWFSPQGKKDAETPLQNVTSAKV
jgi:hypothetical protein